MRCFRKSSAFVFLLAIMVCLISGSAQMEPFSIGQGTSGRQSYPASYHIDGVAYAVQDDPVSDLLYVERDDHIEILQYAGFSSTVRIPNRINNKPVTVVGLEACAIDGIGSFFKGIKKVILPDSIVTLSRNAFYGLDCLQTVEGLENVQELAPYAFSGSYVTEAHFSRKLKRVGQHSFSDNQLRKVTIPDDLLVEPYDQQFMFDDALESLTLIRGSSASTLKLSGSSLISADGKTLIRVLPCYTGSTFTVPDGVECIAWDAFFGLEYIEEFVIPASVTEILNVNFSSHGVTIIAPKGCYAWTYYSENPYGYGTTMREANEKRNLHKRVQEIVSKVIRNGMTPWEKAFALHNWIIDNAEYDRSLTKKSAEDLLFDGTGVCDAYSRAFGALLDEVGITNQRVYCSLKGSPHAINAVKLNGEWVYVDCTNDDVQAFGHPYYLFGFNRKIFEAFYADRSGVEATESIQQYAPLVKGNLKDSQEALISEIQKRIKAGEKNFRIPVKNTDGKLQALALCCLMEARSWKANGATCSVLCDLVDGGAGLEYSIALLTGEKTQFMYRTASDGLCLTEYLGKEETVYVPSSIDGIKVVSLDGTFRDRNDIKKVVLPEGIVEIGDLTFRSCKELKEINFPKSLKKIGKQAFLFCESLASEVTLQKGLTEIGEAAFAYCVNIPKAVIPSTVTSLGKEAFYNCQNLSQVTLREGLKILPEGIFANCLHLYGLLLPDSLETIENGAFTLSGITSIEIPKNVKNIDPKAFFCAKSLKTLTVSKNNKTYASVDQMLLSKDQKTLIFGTWGVKKDLVIPKGVVNIGPNAFLLVPLYSVTIPSGVKKIGECAFAGDNSYTTVTMADSVEEIGDCAFAAAFYYGNDYYMLFSEFNHLKNIRLSRNLKKLGNGVFYGTRLRVLELPDSLTEIPQIINRPMVLYIPSSITKIEDQEIFGDIKDLEIRGVSGSAAEKYARAHQATFVSTSAAITFSHPETVVLLGHSWPLQLTTVDGKAIASAEAEWFTDEESFISIENGVVTGLGEGTANVTARWNGLKASCQVHVVDSQIRPLHIVDREHNHEIVDGDVLLPEQVYSLNIILGAYEDACMDMLIDHTVWSVSDDSIVEILGPGVLQVLRAGSVVLSVALPDGKVFSWNLIAVAPQPKEIPPLTPDEPEQDNPDPEKDAPGESEKTEEPDKTSITAENGKYEVSGKEAAFIAPANKSLKKLVILDTVKIGKTTYKVTSVADHACKNMKNLTSVTIGKNVKNIGKNAFGKCTGLKTLILGKNVTNIGAGAFAGCTSLTDITIKTAKLTEKSVGKNAFGKISSKAVVKVPGKQRKAYASLLVKKGLSKKAVVK